METTINSSSSSDSLIVVTMVETSTIVVRTTGTMVATVEVEAIVETVEVEATGEITTTAMVMMAVIEEDALEINKDEMIKEIKETMTLVVEIRMISNSNNSSSRSNINSRNNSVVMSNHRCSKAEEVVDKD